MIDQIIDYNRSFVERKGYEPFITDKYPDKKLAVLTCMDTRLTELLPAALGLKNGDAKIIKNAGGLILSPFDSAMRSLIVAIYELGVEEIMVVAHSQCGACHMSYSHFHHVMKARGIKDETLGSKASAIQRHPFARRSRPFRPIRSFPRISPSAVLSSTPLPAHWRRLTNGSEDTENECVSIACLLRLGVCCSRTENS